MRKTEEFSAFGITIEVTQFSATEGLEILFSKNKQDVLKMFSSSKIKTENGFESIKTKQQINFIFEDIAGILPPVTVLTAMMKLVENFNFGFLSEWNSVKVPERFTSNSRSVSSKNTPSIVAQLIQDGIANKRELEEYYSLQDAFEMLDIMTAKAVNAALSQEAAERAAKK